jgi:hypothetical protein
MTSLGHPKRFQSEGALNLVCNLLGWSAPVLAERMRRRRSPRRSRRRGVHAVRILPLLRVGAAVGGLRPLKVLKNVI